MSWPLKPQRKSGVVTVASEDTREREADAAIDSLPGDLIGPIRRLHFGGQWTERRLLGQPTLGLDGEIVGYFVAAEPCRFGTGVDAVVVLTDAGRL